MNLPKLEIIEGDVAKVQITSQTQAPARAGVRPKDKVIVSPKVSNQMRIFLLGVDGKERDFQFSNSTVSVADGSRVAIVRAKPSGPGPWLTVALYNLTTQIREEQIGAFARSARQQWLGARWRAIFWAVGVFVVYWPVSELIHLRGHGAWIALAFAVLAYPTAWLIGIVTDWLVLPGRQREAEKALRFAIDEKMSQTKKDRGVAPVREEAAPPTESPSPP